MRMSEGDEDAERGGGGSPSLGKESESGKGVSGKGVWESSFDERFRRTAGWRHPAKIARAYQSHDITW